MTTIGSAEPLPALQRDPADDDKQLMQQAKSSGTTSQPQLRIVHSAGRAQALSPGNMPPRDRTFQATERPPAMLDRSVQAQIGRLLRDVFAGVAQEPVPDRFITLLAELESKEKPR
jgi:hypothetical protein